MNLRQSKPARSYPQLRAEAFSESPIRDPLQRCGTWAEPCEARGCSTVIRTLSRTGSRRFCSGNVSGIAALLPILVLSTRLAVWGKWSSGNGDDLQSCLLFAVLHQLQRMLWLLSCNARQLAKREELWCNRVPCLLPSLNL